jgi:hypothetical protein
MTYIFPPPRRHSSPPTLTLPHRWGGGDDEGIGSDMASENRGIPGKAQALDTLNDSDSIAARTHVASTDLTSGDNECYELGCRADAGEALARSLMRFGGVVGANKGWIVERWQSYILADGC